MDHKRIKTSLEQIRKTYRRILDNTSVSIVIPDAIATVETTRQQYEYNKRNQTRTGIAPKPWGYTIPDNQPLRFIPSKVLKGTDLEIDIYCDIRWEDEDSPVTQDIKVRIWSNHNETIFDPTRDSQEINERLTNPARTHQGRVISRFHFDKANPDQKSGPEYHLQYGGKPEDYELCWHPKKVNVPRLNYQPMELFLTCQMIASNFFWKEYLEIREKSEWREEVIYYQERLLRGYYKKCLDAIENKEPLLDKLWVS